MNEKVEDLQTEKIRSGFEPGVFGMEQASTRENLAEKGRVKPENNAQNYNFEREMQLGGAALFGMPPGVEENTTIPNSDGKEILADAPEFSVDSDKLDKEWLKKMRDTEKQDAEDPRKLANDLYLLKTEFLRQRYGRTLGSNN